MELGSGLQHVLGTPNRRLMSLQGFLKEKGSTCLLSAQSKTNSSSNSSMVEKHLYRIFSVESRWMGNELLWKQNYFGTSLCFDAIVEFIRVI